MCTYKKVNIKVHSYTPRYPVFGTAQSASLLAELFIHVGSGGLMVRAPPVDREDGGSIFGTAQSASPLAELFIHVGSGGVMVRAPSLGHFVHPTLPVSFGRDIKPLIQTPALGQDWAVWSITT